MSQSAEKKLLEDIETAFADSVYPGDENIVYDNNTTHCDVLELREDFRGKHWKDLPFDRINAHRDDLSFLTPEALCHYLPAYLVASISYPPDLIDVLPENLISRLTPGPWGIDERILAILTPQQKHVILDFLAWYANSLIPYGTLRFNRSIHIAIQFWRKQILAL